MLRAVRMEGVITSYCFQIEEIYLQLSETCFHIRETCFQQDEI